MVKIKNILHPTDFSESSTYALKYAISLAKEYKAKLYILHVIPAMDEGGFHIHGTRIPVGLMVEMEREARERLQKVFPPEVRSAIPSEYLFRRGVPFLEIIRYADEIHADLIVCGTHGHTGLKQAIIGSVAENVVRKSRCPVLTVRHPEHKFEMPV